MRPVYLQKKAPGTSIIVFEIHVDDITHTLGHENRETDDEKFLDQAVRTESSCQQRIHHTHTHTHSQTCAHKDTNLLVRAHIYSRGTQRMTECLKTHMRCSPFWHDVSMTKGLEVWSYVQKDKRWCLHVFTSKYTGHRSSLKTTCQILESSPCST